MTQHNADDELAREKAIVAAALAARMWSDRGTRGGEDAPPRLLARLMHAAAAVNRARMGAGRTAVLSLDDMVPAFSAPMPEWLPGADEVCLLEAGLPTPYCEDLAEEVGTDPDAEVEQRGVLAAMDHFSGLAEGDSRYRDYRRFLIEHAVVDEGAGIDRFLTLGLKMADHYERIGPECLDAIDGAEHYFACPRCGWPMRHHDGHVACRSDPCRTAGARFSSQSGHLVPLGALEPPPPTPAEGRRRLRFGLWRYTLLPGLEELALAADLSRIAGVDVELWPHFDAYDLAVRSGSRSWKVDVKDHCRASRLAAQLLERPPSDRRIIVVPDRRQHQVKILRERCREIDTLEFASARELVQRVKKEASR